MTNSPAQVDAVQLVSAFAGLEVMRAAYAHAIATGYRFYSTATPPALESRLMAAFPSPSRRPRRQAAPVC